MNILLAGGSGAIGTHLIERLLISEDTVVTLLSRTVRQSEGNVRFIQWNGESIPEQLLTESFDAVVNLCGAGIADEPWTVARKRILHDSRILPTKALVSFINKAKHKPEVFVSASAVGFYGNRKFELLTEESSKGDGYLADLSYEWEEAAEGVEIRTILLRTGIVMDPHTGAFPELSKTFVFGFGGYFGSGSQGLPWISMEDEVRAIEFCIKNKTIEGPVNLTAPANSSFKEFIGEIAKSRKAITLPAPEFVLKLAMGDRADMLLSSQYIYPQKLIRSGFSFLHPDLASMAEMLTP